MPSFTKRLGKGQIVIPYMLRLIYKRRDDWGNDKASVEKYAILARFATEDTQRHSLNVAEKGFRDYFHPSSAMHCMRAQWLDRTGAPSVEEQNIEEVCKKYRIFDHGDFTHLRWAVMFERLEMLVFREKPFVDTANHICGTADGAVKIGEETILYDIKTCNSRSFSRMASGDMQQGYVMQLQEYLHQHKIKRGVIIFENKDTQEVGEYPVEYDRKCHQEIIERCHAVLKAVQNREPPAREFPSRSVPPCSWCAYNSLCWSSRAMSDYVKSIQGDGNAFQSPAPVEEVRPPAQKPPAPKARAARGPIIFGGEPGVRAVSSGLFSRIAEGKAPR